MAEKELLSIVEIEKRYPDIFEMSETKMLEELQLASQVYYNTQNSIMSDERYDSMEIVFKNKFPDNKEILKVGADTNEISDKILGFEKQEHTRVKGKTQHKAQNIKELLKNLENLTTSIKTKLKEQVENGEINKETMNDYISEIKKVEEQTYIMSEKLDGVSLYATYDKNGNLSSVVTRGDGEVGDNITENAKKLNGVPSKIDMSIYKDIEGLEFVEIRGEGIMLNKNFKQLVKIYENLGKDLKNARNATAGVMRRLDGNYLEYVDFMPYEEIIELNDGTIFQRDEKIQMETLDSLGFNTPKWLEVQNIENMEKEYKKYIETSRKKLRTEDEGYEIDGLVFKLNSNHIQDILGMASNRQNGQIALKFPPEIAITKLIDIEWSESYNGIITPVAVVEPITIGGVEEIDEEGNIKVIGGVTIERMSLANQNIMDQMLLTIGDNIVISRRNDVIPKIEKNLKLEEFYISFHKFIHTVLIPEIDKSILSLSHEDKRENTFRERLLEFKDGIEMELSSDMYSLELKINKIIHQNLFKDGEFLENSYKNDKKILSHVFRDFTSNYKKEFNKQLESFEKKYSKSVFIKEKVDELIDNVKEKTKELVHNIDNKLETMKDLNKNNVKFISSCPTCGNSLSMEDSNMTCVNSDCSNLQKGKIGTFIVKNKNLIVAGELKEVDKFFTNFKGSELTKENYMKTLKTETLSLEATKIWDKFLNGEINSKILKTEIEDEAKKSGIGSSKISELFNSGIATTIKDLFSIKLEDFVIGKDSKGRNEYMEGWGERAISNLIKDINKLSKLTDVQFLTAMNFKSAASSRIEKILQVFNYKDLINGNVTREDIMGLKGFSSGIADDLIPELEEKREEMLELIDIIDIKETKSVVLDESEKINFVITGSVVPNDKNNPSEEWLELEKKMIESGFSKSKKIDGVYKDIVDRGCLTDYLKKGLGHEVQKKVSGTTDFLINIDITSTTSKNADAIKNGVPIISPEEVNKILKEGKKKDKTLNLNTPNI